MCVALKHILINNDLAIHTLPPSDANIVMKTGEMVIARAAPVVYHDTIPMHPAARGAETARERKIVIVQTKINAGGPKGSLAFHIFEQKNIVIKNGNKVIDKAAQSL